MTDHLHERVKAYGSSSKSRKGLVADLWREIEKVRGQRDKLFANNTELVSLIIKLRQEIDLVSK